MARPAVGCCKPTSTHGAARLHWFHGDDCVLGLAGVEIDPFATSVHPAGSNYKDLRTHPPMCLCERHVYIELNLDRDDDITDVEVEV